MRRKESRLVEKNRATVKPDSSIAPRWMKTYSESRIELRNLQILKKMLEKSSQFCPRSRPVSRKALTLPWKLQKLKKYPRKTCGYGQPRSHLIRVLTDERSLNTERTYKWKLSGSARQSEIGILCFDWLIHPGVSYSREIWIFSEREGSFNLWHPALSFPFPFQRYYSGEISLCHFSSSVALRSTCCFKFLCTEYGTVWGITECCSIYILFAPS